MTTQQIDTIQAWKDSREQTLIQNKIGQLTPPRPYSSDNYPLELSEYRQAKSRAIADAERQVEIEFKLIFPILGENADKQKTAPY